MWNIQAGLLEARGHLELWKQAATVKVSIVSISQSVLQKQTSGSGA